MLKSGFISRLSLAVVCMSVLSACTSITSVKDVTNDPSAYLSKKFSLATLSPNIAKKVPVDGINPTQDGLSLVTEANYETPDGKKDTWKTKFYFKSLGNGLFQTTAEKLNNDIAYRVSYALTYRGMMDLRWQGVPLRGAMTDPLYEIKDTVRFDSMPTTLNKEFVFDYSWGNEVQIANYLNFKKVCKATRQLSASDIHKKLNGMALQIECEYWTNNSVQSRSKWMFFQSYGVAVQTESVASGYKTVIRVVDVIG